MSRITLTKGEFQAVHKHPPDELMTVDCGGRARIADVDERNSILPGVTNIGPEDCDGLTGKGDELHYSDMARQF